MTQIIINETTPIIVEVSTPGPQGSSGTASVGTVTTGASGSAAAVTNSGTPSAAVFNFTIPKGDIGDVTPAATAAKNAAEAAAVAAAASELAAETAEQSADDFAASALASAIQASASASTASIKAQEAITSANNASNSAQSVLAASNTATTKAQEAATSASNALASANTASTKAQEASASEVISTTKAQEAVVSASTATNAATSASTSAASALVSKQVTTDNAALAIAQATIASTKATQAAASEAEALVQASVATAQANISTAQAVIATAQADISTTQAAAALASAQASAASASTSSTQAGISTTQASAASASASNAALSASAAAASQVLAAGSATAANTSAGNASGSAASALAIYGSAAAQQTALANAQAAASLAQGFAASAASVVQQDLSGVTSAALHRSPNAVTAMFLYDTSKDSDGGAWTEKCQSTSWYNEALTGKWLGSAASEILARNIGGTLSAEQAPTPDFSSSAGWSLIAGASISNGALFLDAQINSRAETTGAGLTYNIGDVIEVTLVISETTGGSQNIIVQGNNTGTGFNQDLLYIGTPSVGTFTGRFVTTGAYLTGSNPFRIIKTVSTGTTKIDSISVKKVTALTTSSNDYFQLTTDGKFYRLWKNLLSYSNNFENAVWTKGVSTVTPDAIAGPDGSVTADAIVESITSGNQGLYRTLPDYGRKTFAFDVKAGGRQYFTMNWFAGDNNYSARLTVDLATGSVTQWAASNGGNNDYTYIVTSKGNGWYRIAGSYTRVAGGFPTRVWFGPSDTSTASGESKNYLGDGRTAIYLSNFQVEEGSVTTAYEAKTVDGGVGEIFRGNKRKFPKLAGIVAEKNASFIDGGFDHLAIYDLTEPGRPMWMSFKITNQIQMMLGYQNGLQSYSVALLNGTMCVTASQSGGGGLNVINFPLDFGVANYGNTIGYNTSNIANRHLVTTQRPNYWSAGIVGSRAINAVAMTVLPDAPVDPVTGLKVPTIAVATGGGVSVIKHNGTVVNSASTSSHISVGINRQDLYAILASQAYVARNIGTLNAGFAWSSPNLSAGNPPIVNSGFGSYKVQGSGKSLGYADSRGMFLLKDNNVQSKGIGTTIYPTFNTGHLVGDIRRAYLADVDTGSVSGTELVSTSWLASGSGDITFSGSTTLTIVRGSGGILGLPYQTFATVIGKTYQVIFDLGAVSNNVRVGTGIQNGTFASFSGTGVFKTTFTATTTLVYISAWPNNPSTTTTLSGYSIQECSADRSYKAQAASINGSLVKSQVASAAQLVAYSGFSASNYLREPYSADLDFGTGEWSVGAWVNVPVTLTGNTFPVVSSELLVNGGFTDASGWTLGAGITVGSGVATFTNVVNDTAISRTDTTYPTDKTYKVTFTVSNWVSGSFRLVWPFTSSTFVGGNGTYTVYGKATDSRFAFRTITGNGNGSFDIDNISVVEVGSSFIVDRAYSSGSKIQLGVNLAGNLTATAFDGTTTRTVTTTAAYKTATWLKAEAQYKTDGSLCIVVNGQEVAVTRGTPLLSLNSRYNLLTKTEDFADAAWNKANTTVPVTQYAAPDGTVTADLLLETAASGTHGVNRTIASVDAITTPYTSSIYVKGSGRTKGDILFSSENAPNPSIKGVFDLVANSLTITTGGTAVSTASSITPLPNGWYKISITGYTGASGTHSFRSLIYDDSGNVSYTGDITKGVFIWGASLAPSALSALPYQWVNTATDFAFAAPLTIGNSFAADAPFPGSITLLKASATVPTAEQMVWMYEQEKQMFRDGAQVTLPDANAIVDLTYDDLTDKWIAVSATNESEWSGLVRTSVTVAPAGSYSKITATSGIQLQARTTTNPGVDITIPAGNLREELLKDGEDSAKVNAQLAIFDYVGGFTANTTINATSITSAAGITYPVSYIGARVTGTGIPTDTFILGINGTTLYLSKAATATGTAVQLSFTDFILAVGYEAKVVLSAGLVKTEGTTKDYVRLFDGFKETIRFGTAPGYNTAVQIQATRSIQ